MDERSARTMFRHLAERNLEETTVDVDEAIRGGRRRRRRRTLVWIAGAAVLVIGGISVVTVPMLRDEPKAMPPAAPPSAPGFVEATDADLKPDTQRLQVGRPPEGMVGTAFDNGEDYQSVRFLRTESDDSGGGGPIPGYGPASVWLTESASSLTIRASDDVTEPGPDIYGAPSTWSETPGGDTPGGALVWTPSAGLRATVIAGSKEAAVRIAESVRTDQVAPVVLPFTMPRPTDLEVMGTAVTRYANGHYSGAVTFRKAGDTAQAPSHITFWLARDALAKHNGPLPTKLHGRPARLSEGPPENGVNVWLRLDSGVMVGSLDAANNGVYRRNRSQIIAMVESMQPVPQPGDHRNWTKDFLR